MIHTHQPAEFVHMAHGQHAQNGCYCYNSLAGSCKVARAETGIALQVDLPPLPPTTVVDCDAGYFSLEDAICGCLRLDPQRRHTAEYMVDQLYVIKSSNQW